MAKSSKYSYTNGKGETKEIFRGNGFCEEYIHHRNLPFLNEKNEWESGDIQLYPLPFKVRERHPLQIYMKQQSLQKLFKMKFKKPDLLDDKLVVGYYGYENHYKEGVFYYGIISLAEFIRRFYDDLKFPLLFMTTYGVDEILEAIDNELFKINEEKRIKKSLEDRRMNLSKLIEEERKEKIVYKIIRYESGGYIVTRYTPASHRTKRLESKNEVQLFIDSNKKGDSRNKNGIAILFYDEDIELKKW